LAVTILAEAAVGNETFTLVKHLAPHGETVRYTTEGRRGGQLSGTARRHRTFEHAQRLFLRWVHEKTNEAERGSLL